MLLQTYNLIEIMNELKKKRSRFTELIETYCGANPYNFDLFLANVMKDEYVLSIMRSIYVIPHFDTQPDRWICSERLLLG